MKKTLLSLLLIPFFGVAQNQFAFGFDGTTADMLSAGWQLRNTSNPIYAGAPNWSIASYVAPTTNSLFGSTTPQGYAGGANSFALVNYTSAGTSSTAGSGTISNYLITPNITVANGDVVTFYSRKGTDGTTDFADRLELRMSTASTTVLPGETPPGPPNVNDVGTFTTVAVTVNPTLATGFVYPKVWTQYSYTVVGLSAPTAVKFAFRYFVTNGGPEGANSDLIGIDSFSVDRPAASTQSFFANNFSIFPNPANSVLNVMVKNGLSVNQISMIDINGRTVKTINNTFDSELEINVSNLAAGIYILNVNTEQGVATSKFVKN